MNGRDNKEVAEALNALKSRPSGGRSEKPQDCGDIGLSIARDGTWYYQGSPISRLPLVKLFASVLRLEGDGRYYLVTPVERVVIDVEDVPFLAIAMERAGEGESQRLSFTTNLGETVEAGREHPIDFRMDADGTPIPYILIEDGLKARLTRPVYYELIEMGAAAVEQPGIWSGGVFFPFPAVGKGKGKGKGEGERVS